MTINVIVKCPDGIVMGTDSLQAIYEEDSDSRQEPDLRTIMPYYSKLFSMEPFSAGAMINGDLIIAGRNIDDIISEFSETPSKGRNKDNYRLEQLTQDLASKIRNIVNQSSSRQFLEIIVGGYSKGIVAEGRRYGEIYKIIINDKQVSVEPLYGKDTQFGTLYGGQPKCLDRFRFGFDDWMLNEIMKRRKKVFRQVRNYILSELRSNGIVIPQEVGDGIKTPPLAGFDVFYLFSNYKGADTAEGLIRNIKEGMVWALETSERFFTLQTAINYCSFLMECAYAESAFTFVIPTVGSEMRIATITRNEGFSFKKRWEIQTPGPPFR